MKKELTDTQKLKIVVHALLKCSNPAGAYNPDKLQHATNCIKNVEGIAKKALDKIGIDYPNIIIDQ